MNISKTTAEIALGLMNGKKYNSLHPDVWRARNELTAVASANAELDELKAKLAQMESRVAELESGPKPEPLPDLNPGQYPHVSGTKTGKWVPIRFPPRHKP